MKTCIFEFQCINFTKTWSTEEWVDTVCITEPCTPLYTTLQVDYALGAPERRMRVKFSLNCI